jgi:Na+/proline symporter
MFAWRLGSILQTIVKVNSYFYGCLLGIFLLGMLTRRGNERGALAGLAVGIATVLGCSAVRPEYWIWFGAVGCLSCFSIGYVVSSGKLNDLRLDTAQCARN